MEREGREGESSGIEIKGKEEECRVEVRNDSEGREKQNSVREWKGKVEKS